MYFTRMRRYVYVTPKSYLCFIEFYQKLYVVKYQEVNVQEKSVNMGLQKLKEASTDVENMKVELREQEKVLKVEEEKTNKLLVKVQSEKAKAEKKAAEVGVQKDGCLATAEAISKDKKEANIELQKAIPFLNDANAACKSITPKDITELKTNKNPVDVVRLTFDGMLILQQLKVVDVKAEDKTINKISVPFIHDSFDECA